MMINPITMAQLAAVLRRQAEAEALAHRIRT